MRRFESEGGFFLRTYYKKNEISQRILNKMNVAYQVQVEVLYGSQRSDISSPPKFNGNLIIAAQTHLFIMDVIRKYIPDKMVVFY